MAHDGQDIDGVFGGAHRVGAGAKEAAAGVMDVLQRILAQNAESQERLLQTVLRAVSKDDTSGLPSGLKASNYPDLRSDKRHVRPWADGVEGWTTVVGWRVNTVETHQKLISYLVQRLHKSKAASAWWRGCVAQKERKNYALGRELRKGMVRRQACPHTLPPAEVAANVHR